MENKLNICSRYLKRFPLSSVGIHNNINKEEKIMSSVTITFDGDVVTPKNSNGKVGQKIKFVNDNDRPEDINFPNGSPCAESTYTVPANGKIKCEICNEGTFTFNFKEEGAQDPSGEIFVRL